MKKVSLILVAALAASTAFAGKRATAVGTLRHAGEASQCAFAYVELLNDGQVCVDVPMNAMLDLSNYFDQNVTVSGKLQKKTIIIDSIVLNEETPQL